MRNHITRTMKVYNVLVKAFNLEMEEVKYLSVAFTKEPNERMIRKAVEEDGQHRYLRIESEVVSTKMYAMPETQFLSLAKEVIDGEIKED